jgi:hypothetical protein
VLLPARLISSDHMWLENRAGPGIWLVQSPCLSLPPGRLWRLLAECQFFFFPAGILVRVLPDGHPPRLFERTADTTSDMQWACRYLSQLLINGRR